MFAKNKISILTLVVWVCGIVFFLYEFFLRAFVGTFSQSIIHDLNLSPELFALMGSAYYISYSIMQIPVGFLTDRLGAKKIIVFASILCGLSVVLFAISGNFATAFAARFLMGLGSSFGFVSLLVIITNWFPQPMHANVIGFSSFIGTLGPLLAGGPLVTVVKTLNTGWRPMFVAVGLFGLVFALICFFLIRSKTRKFDTAFIKVEKKHNLSAIILKLVRNKQAWFIGLYSAFMYEVTDFLGAIWGTFYLQSRGLTLTEAGYTISFVWLGYGIGCFALMLCSQRIKKRKPCLIFCSCIGLVAICINNYIQVSHTWMYCVLFFLIGIASSGQSLGIAVILEHVQKSVRALALGFNNTLIIFFAAIVPVASSPFIHLPKDSPARPSNFLVGFSVLPLLLFVALIIAVFFIQETFCRPQRENTALKL